MQLFNLLGLTPSEKEKDNTGKVKIRKETVAETEEKVKWSRPGHTIERNKLAAEKAKELRKALKN